MASDGMELMPPPPPVVTEVKSGEETGESGGATSGTQIEAVGVGEKARASQGVPVPLAAYIPPEWGGTPREVEYNLEIFKDGRVLSQQDVSKKGHYTIGRNPSSDIAVSHPSTSRCHAVIQYNGHTGEAFLYDAGSTHGTFLNKRRIKSLVYAPLRVGDIFKIGSSSRMYVFNGPADLMPQEGMNRHQKLMMGKLIEADKQRERDKQVAAAQMQSAISGGISWGMGEDAVEEEDPDEDLDWKAHALKSKLTDKQQKLVDKIRSRELKITHMQKECERIEAKKKTEGSLTQGQAVTLARNEQVIERLADEIDDFEELLKDSIRESISAKEKLKDGKKRKKKRNESDDDDDQNSDEDDFYDRTDSTKKKKKMEQYQKSLFTPEALYSKQIDLEKRKEDLQKRLVKCNEVITHSQGGKEDDALDSYMKNVVDQIDSDQITSLESQLREVEKELADANKLLSISDPEGLFNPQNVKKEEKEEIGVDSVKAVDSVEIGGIPGEDLSKPKDMDLMPPPPPPLKMPTSQDCPPPGPAKGRLETAVPKNGQDGTNNIINSEDASEGPNVSAADPKNVTDGLANSKARLEVIADLETLSAATKPLEEASTEEECKDWKPPEGQSGDGRTHLNAKFGY